MFPANTPAAIAGTLIAGLGLFFAGMKLLVGSVRLLAGRRLRLLAARLTGHPWLAAMWGVGLGAVTQNNSVVTFIVVSLVASRVVTLAAGLPMVAWANVGVSILAPLAVLDTHVAVLYLVGVAGLAYDRERPARLRPVAGTLLGVGLVFLGLDLLRAGAAPLEHLGWIRAELGHTHGVYVLAFAMGIVVSVLAQSSAAATILAVTLMGAGLLGVEDTIAVIYGANVGSGLRMWPLCAGLRGVQKQLVLYQMLVKFAGAAVLAPLFYLEVYGGVPLVGALVRGDGLPIKTSVALVHVLYQVVAAVALGLLHGPVCRLLDRWSPASEDERLEIPNFVFDRALEDPETALDLVDREQVRLLRLTRASVAAALPGAGPSQGTPESRGQAYTTIAEEVTHFLEGLADRKAGPETSARLMATVQRQHLLAALEEEVNGLARTAAGLPSASPIRGLAGRFLEGLDVLLATAVDAVSSRDPEELEMLLTMSGDKSGVMERLRGIYLAGEAGLDAPSRLLLFGITSQFERVAWIVHRLANVTLSLSTQTPSPPVP